MKWWISEILENTDWVCTSVVPSVGTASRQGKVYAFELPRFMAEVRIPQGMTKQEADRLCAFIKTLVAPEAS